MLQSSLPSIIRLPIVGFLAWLVPGLGHIFIGQRSRGLVCLVTIVATFWTGVAIGGVRTTVDPKAQKMWFMAQMCSGGNALAAYGLQRMSVARVSAASHAAMVSRWRAIDVAVHYTGVAGLLNVLVILDALGRAELAGRSKREVVKTPRGAS